MLFPGTVTVYIPWRIVGSFDRALVVQSPLEAIAATAVIVIGAGVLLRCVWDFFARGRGTLAPLDPPRRLVVSGLYRYTRNPMYNGVLAVLLGEAWLFHSLVLLQYAAVMFVIFHTFIIFYEEPTLAAQFGESYDEYRATVPRWGARRQ